MIEKFRRNQIIGLIVDRLYDFWADRRLTWTGRLSLAEIIAHREKEICENNGCDLPVTSGSKANG